MMAISLLLCTVEAFVQDLFEVTTTNSVHFLTRSRKLPMPMHKDRVQISIHVYSGKPRNITDLRKP